MKKPISKPLIAAVVIGKLAQHALVFLVLAGISAAVLAKDCYDYLEGVPKITPFTELTVPSEITLSCDELAYFEQTEHAEIIGAQWEDGSMDGLYIPPDGKTLRISGETGVLTVHVNAFGTTAECVGEDIFVTVRNAE